MLSVVMLNVVEPCSQDKYSYRHNYCSKRCQSKHFFYLSSKNILILPCSKMSNSNYLPEENYQALDSLQMERKQP